MNERQSYAVMVLLIVGMAAGFLLLLFKPPTEVIVEKRVTDYAAESAAGTLRMEGSVKPTSDAVDIRGELQTFEGQPGSTKGAWRRFRAVDFENNVGDGPLILEQWPTGGPPVIWRLELGQGYAGPAVNEGRVFILDYDEEKGGDALRCFSFDDGREIWRRSYRAPIKKNHGFSRTVPAVTDDFVVTLGPRCIAMCVRPSTGEFLWGMDLVADFGSEVPLWYTGQCPLIDDGVAVFAPGGQSLLVGVDCESGEIVWKTPNADGWNMSHSSVVPAKLLGRRMYVYCAKEGVVGVSADAGDRGTVLWKSTAWAHPVTSPSPLPIDARRIFLTAGYGGGSMMLGLTEEQSRISAEPIYEIEKTVFSCEQHTPLLFQNHLFAVLPKDAGEFRSQFACMDLSGEVVWTSGKTERFGLGPFLRANDKMFILDDDGTLTLIRASLSGYEHIARARVLQGREAWAPMALVDGFLLLRDFEEMICLDVRAHPQLMMKGDG